MMFLKNVFWMAWILAVLFVSCIDKQGKSNDDSAQEPIASEKVSGETAADTSRVRRYFAKGEEFAKESQYDSAMIYFVKASELYEAEENWDEYLHCYNKLGEYSWRIDEIEEAKKYLEKALEVGHNKLGEMHPRVAMSYLLMGNNYVYEGDYDQAATFYRKALSIQLVKLGKGHADVASSYSNLGITYYYKGDYGRAREFFEKALPIFLEVFGEDHFNVARTYNNMGNIFADTGDLDQALDYYNKALTITLEVFGEEHSNVAFFYDNIGSIHAEKGNYNRALSFYEKAVSIFVDAFGEDFSRLATVYLNMGNTYSEKGDYNQALLFHQKALSIDSAIYGEAHPFLATDYLNIGQVYSKKADYEKALAFYNKALSIRLAAFGELNPDVAFCYNNIAEMYQNKGDYSRAIDSYSEAIHANVPGFANQSPYLNPPLENVLSETVLLSSLFGKARAMVDFFVMRPGENMQDLEAAVSTYQHASELIDRIRSGYKAQGSKLFLGAEAANIYDNAIKAALKLFNISDDSQHLETAFLFAEKGKFGILLDALSEAEAKQFVGISDSLLEKERQLRIDLTYYDDSLLEEQLLGEAADSVKIVKLQNSAFNMKRSYEALLQQFESDYPDYYNLKYQVKTASVKEIQQQIVDANSAMVEYFVGEDSIFVFTITPEQFDITSVAKDALFEETVQQLREAVTQQNYEQYTTAAYRLYQTLLQPVEASLFAEKLIIIPDGSLNYVPFEALLTESIGENSGIKDYSVLPFLIKKHAVSYAYSATLLLETLRRQKEEVSRDYLACAPVFPDGIPAKTRGAELVTAHRALDSTRSLGGNSLPASREEVLGIQELFNKRAGIFERWFGSKTAVYLEKDATEEKLKSAGADNYRYVHFSTHGFVNESEPKLSGLILTPQDDTGVTEDGILYLGEVYNFSLNADLVVLSACETGLGKIARGEGLIGLTRGFLYAGAQNLLVSLWQVNDASTANLMMDFYNSMLDGKSKSTALREAKLALMESDSKYARPYYWAPFVLIGK
jgi:CHAT domain-containing protein/tetratricopeptide (TPR) repeat protein